MNKKFVAFQIVVFFLFSGTAGAAQKGLFVELTQDNYTDEVLSYKGSCVVLFYNGNFDDDFSSRRMYEVITSLAGYYKTSEGPAGRRIKFCLYDYEKNIKQNKNNRARAAEILSEYGNFKVLPVTLLYKNGKNIDRMDGAPSSGYEQVTVEEMRKLWITPLLLDRLLDDGKIYKYQGSFHIKEAGTVKLPVKYAPVGLIDDILLLYGQTGASMNVNRQKAAEEYIAIFKNTLTELAEYDLSPLDESDKKILSGAFGKLGLSLKVAMNNLEDAQNMYALALRLYPENTAAMLSLGMLYFKDYGDYEKALKLYEKILSIEPNNAIAKIYRGKCIENLKR